MKPGDRRLMDPAVLKAHLDRLADESQEMIINHLNRLFHPDKARPQRARAPTQPAADPQPAE